MENNKYFDNAATTKMAPEVLEAMLPYLTQEYGNSATSYGLGRSAAAAVDKARNQVACSINAKPEQIIFTSGGSEANSLAITGLDYNRLREKRGISSCHIITTTVEHSSVRRAAESLASRNWNEDCAISVTYLVPDRFGEITVDQVKEAIRPDTVLVSVMTVNNETGNIYPIIEIGELCRFKGILFHTDAVQAYHEMDFDMEDYPIDFLSASGHKIYGPKGVGFLYCRDKTLLNPIIFGGEQEYGLRGGTTNTAAIVGLGEAAANIWYGDSDRMLQCDDFADCIPGAHINGSPVSPSNIINLRIDGVDGESLMLALDAKGFAVSTGSACNSHAKYPSRVLKAMGLTDEEANSSIRISTGRYNNYDDMWALIEAIRECVEMLRGC